MNDNVNHPPHYKKSPSGIECIEVVEHMNFNKGNAIKYCWRSGEKGDEIEDLKKAAWYINREIERIIKSRKNLYANRSAGKFIPTNDVHATKFSSEIARELGENARALKDSIFREELDRE